MEQKRKATLLFRLICLTLITVTILPFALVGCAGGGHVCEHKCEVCGYCTDKSCEDKACEQKCRGHETGDTDVTVTKVDIEIYPKTEYLPGEVFDITNLLVKATLSNGKKKTIRDSKFTEWTHKGEELTTAVTKITFTLPGYDFTFDLPITVAMPENLSLVVDTQTLKTQYTTDETINFSTISVKLMTGSVAEVLDIDDWYLTYNGTKVGDITAVSAKTLGEGEKTFTVVYLPTVTKNITVNLVSADKTISPAFIEAEDCVYKLGNNNEETVEKYVVKENKTWVEYYDSEAAEVKVSKSGYNNGSSGAGAVSSLAANQSGKNVYFKFKVKVPAAGTYKILARANGTGGGNVKGKFNVNLNGATGSDGKLAFTANNVDSSITRGNQVADYYSKLQGEYRNWYSLFWWGMLDLGGYTFKAGENEVRIYMPNGLNGNIDYFEIVENTATDTAKIISMRDGVRVDCSIAGNKVTIAKGEKLTDVFDLPEEYPLTYSLLYIRTSAGKEIPVLGSMLEGAVDYDKVGEQVVTVKDPVSKEEASFTLVIEERKTQN